MSNLLNIVLMAQQQGGGAAGMLSQLLPLVLIIVVFYFFMIRPQMKRQKEAKKFRESLQKGDEILTNGGIYGTIDEVRDNFVFVEIDKGVRIKIDRASVLQYADGTVIKK